MSRTIIYLWLLSAPVLLISCSKKAGPLDPVPKDPRGYNWTVDTISPPGNLQTWLTRIWGSSPTDVYVAGSTDAGSAKVFHYNGTSWERVPLHSQDGGPVRGAYQIGNIGGDGPSNVFAVGALYPSFSQDSSLIVHYDGNRWSVIRTPSGRILNAIWVADANEVWMGGLDGTLFHYDGTRLVRDTLPISIPLNVEKPFNIISIAGRKNIGAYLLMSAPHTDTPEERYYLFEAQGFHWNLVDSMGFYCTCLWMAPTGELYLGGNNIMKRTGHSWVPVPQPEGIKEGIDGTASDNFFAVGTSHSQTAILHFNGVDFYEYTNIKPALGFFTGIWTDGKEAFVAGVTLGGSSQKTIVAHGR